MNITPINVNCKHNSPNFNGKIINKGFGWTPILRQTFSSSRELKEMSKGYDVVGRLNVKKLPTLVCNKVTYNQNLYDLKISFRKENSLKDKIKDALGLLPRYSLSRNFHTEDGIADCLDKAHLDRIKAKLNK